jgi:predicted membrane protein (TIGR00267 family)
MSRIRFWLSKREGRLSCIAGLCDGILTALILAAGTLLRDDQAMSIGLALRVACGALASGAFVFFVAHYAELRGELVHAERELNLTSRGRFATTQLGPAVLREAAVAAVIASGSTFVGALLPLLVSALFPRPAWLSIAVAIATLGVLGIGLAKSIFGSPLRWGAALVLGGISVSLIGLKLHIL